MDTRREKNIFPVSFGPEKRGKKHASIELWPGKTGGKPSDALGFTLCHEKNDRGGGSEQHRDNGRGLSRWTYDRPQAMGKPAEGNKLRERLRDVLWRVSRLTVSSKTGELVN